MQCAGALHYNISIVDRIPVKISRTGNYLEINNRLDVNGLKKIFYAGIVLAVLLVMAGTVSASTNLVTNGGFETPVISGWTILNTVPGWTLDDTQIEYQTASTVGLVPAEGNQYAELDPYYNVRISEVISVHGGTTYDISFAQACRCDDPNMPSKLGVYWDNTYLGQTSCTVTPKQSQYQAWITHTYTVTPAADANVKLTFKDEGVSDSYGVLLDDVKVEARGPTPVPEFPGTLIPVTFIVGTLMLVLFIRIKTE
jgi:hypothetical protein